jgi:hypothetical protein
MMEVIKGGNAPVHLVLTSSSYRGRISSELLRERINTARDNEMKRARRQKIKEKMGL